MKDLSSRWVVAALLAPVLLIVGLTFFNASRPASAAPVPKNKGFVAVAFVASGGDTTAVPDFKSMGLNVVSIRMHHSSNLKLSDFDPGWVTIQAAAGVGPSFGIGQIATGNNFGGNFGLNGSTVAIGEGRAEMQIDLNAIQSLAQVFNTQAIVANTYNQLEVVLDPATPANLVPLCLSSPNGEGCISYKATFPTPTPTPGFAIPLRILIPKGLDVVKQQLTPLVIAFTLNPQGPPTNSLSAIVINPSIAVVPNSGSANPITNPQLGTLQVDLHTTASSGFNTNRPETITAEVAGTNQVVESVTLPATCNGKTTCTIFLQLPAFPASAGGTSYDLVASGKTTSYAVRSSVTVNAGEANITSVTGANALSITNRATVGLTGNLTDTCSGGSVQAATLQLLVQDSTVSTPDCTKNPPVGCVAAATAQSDEGGNFPLPGNGFKPPQFSQIPLPKPSATPYTMVVTAAGYDRTFTQVVPAGFQLKCKPSTKGLCDLSLAHGIASGTVSLSKASPLNTSVLVVAEDSTTNNIENVQMATIPAGATSAPYTMNVPDNANPGPAGPITQLDFYGSAQDLMNGAPQEATGHSIAVLGAIAAPAPPAPTCATVTGVDLVNMTCAGHSSVNGTVTNPTQFSTVAIAKNNVQLESVPVVPPGAPNAALYTICAPAGTYDLLHLENGVEVARLKGQTLPGPSFVPPTPPTPTPTPCPGICDAGQATGQCLICNGSFSVTLP